MNTGIIEGGWSFVYAAYGISAAILIGYSLSVLLRYRHERARSQGGAAETGQ